MQLPDVSLAAGTSHANLDLHYQTVTVPITWSARGLSFQIPWLRNIQWRGDSQLPEQQAIHVLQVLGQDSYKNRIRLLRTCKMGNHTSALDSFEKSN